MRYYRVGRKTNSQQLVAASDESAYDLTSAAGITSFTDLVRVAQLANSSPDEIAAQYLSETNVVDVTDGTKDLLPPVVAEEVWAAGVTYEISEEARKTESAMPEIYLDVYEASRPEIFFKATPNRVVAPGEAVGIRSDSDWNVPEPELGLVLYRGELVGYTIGNDMSSRDIEGENPLYLPQAKVYDRCCSLGPCVVPAVDIDDPHDLEMAMKIERDGEIVFTDRTSTGEMVRTCDELVSYFVRHNTVPELSVLMTGTSLVPPDDFTLLEDDVVRIDIEGIGQLTNPVTMI